MSDVEQKFHETWLGMVQPIEGLVVSIPVLVDAQCMERQPPETQGRLLALCPPTRMDETGPAGRAISDLSQFLAELLGLVPALFDAGDALPEELSLYVPEGKQTLRPTLALRKQDAVEGMPEGADATPASRAGARYEMLVWEVPPGLDLDKPEALTGSWDYPPSAKLDRLLRHCRVPIGLLTNREALRLVYAPHGESTGSITFRIDDMASVGGRPILDAFVMLLGAHRFFGVAPERALPALLAESRKRQANVTNELAEQVFEALAILLRGFEAAAERDGRDLLEDALGRANDHLYKGLLTVLLRLVFVLYAEDRGLLPVEHPLYEEHLSLLGLFEELQSDHGAYPDSMSRRFGAWGRVVSLFRAIYLGVEHGSLRMPPRRGSLFNPHTYPFLEGWGPAGSAPIGQPEIQAEVRLPTVDDETVFRVLEKLLVFEAQRLSYRALDVEQIGSVYEALMGYHVVRVPGAAVCLRPDRLWVTAEEVLEVPAKGRAKWLKDTVGLSGAQAEKLAGEIAAAEGPEGVLSALGKYAAGGRKADPALGRARPLQLVLQPGSERRRTSSHYTPRSLSAPIVRRTLEPLLAVMGEAPASERILNLKICDPAMGSGAFLVEACRFLADHVLAAWTREGQIEAITRAHGDPLMHARRMVAQRCLYGVDKNESAVELGKLSLWLVTLARDLPFTFLDHALCHGDSLVGLDFDQIRSFHWKPGKQLELFKDELGAALKEAIEARQRILELAEQEDRLAQREKERLLWDAKDALDRVRLIGDLVVGAFFAYDTDKEREKERERRIDKVTAWLRSGEPAPEELLGMQAEIRGRLPVFHWMVEFPEVFYAERPDPLDDGQVNRAAWMDAFVGNPPFAGKNAITEGHGEGYVDWLMSSYEGAFGNTDLCAYFFRRSALLLGKHGTMGFVATNTIAQGDTRGTSIQWLVRHGAVIHAAETSREWPGAASVEIAVVHLAFGAPAIQAKRSCVLDGVAVDRINSRLRGGAEQSDPFVLASNRGLDYMGGKLIGSGFVLTPQERAELIRSDSKNDAVIRPYMGGEDINQNPGGEPQRYAIYFGTMSLEEASAWPTILRIVEERVRPERQKNNRSTYRTYWWRPGETGGALYEMLVGLQRCLVTARVTKHLCFSFQPTDRVFNEKIYVFPFDRTTQFAVLQSRVHSAWTWLLSSTTKTDLNYSASDCFETFPFPQSDTRTVIPALESIGQRLYDFRAQYMLDNNVGLTITYNRLKDPNWEASSISELRRLHEEMDRAVLDAYDWTDIDVPPYCPITDEDKRKLERFEDEVIDRLFVLNAQRAEEEKLRGLAPATAKQRSAGKGKRGGRKTDASPEQAELPLAAKSQLPPPPEPVLPASDPAKDAAAEHLSRWHFLAEPGIQEIHRILAPREVVEEEPIKLLEVVASRRHTAELTCIEIEPIPDIPYRTRILQLSPEELAQVQNGELELPEGWSLERRQYLPRPDGSDRVFHIDEMTLVNFRSFEQRTFTFPGDMNVLIGKNGRGKTAILDALAIAAGPLLDALAPDACRKIREEDARRASYGKGGIPTIEPQFPVKIESRGITSDEGFRWERVRASSGLDTEPTSGQVPQILQLASFIAELVRKGMDVTLPLLSYYGTGRLWRRKSQGIEPMKPGSRLRGYEGCLDPDSGLGSVWGWFKQMELTQLQQDKKFDALEAAKRAIVNCLDGWDDVRYDVQLDEIVARAQSGLMLPFRMLSDGIRNMLAMVADMAYRAALLNPHLEGEVTEKTPGIVLIDEIDLHLHPTWQRRVIDDLRRTFPRVQFFATTHSPFIVQALKPGELIDLDEQSGDYYQRSIEDIAEDVMGVPMPQRSKRWQDMMKAAEEYYRLLNEPYTTPEELAERKTMLDELIEPFSDNPAYVAFLKMEREAAGLGGDG
jgi:predicted ATP-binding protein involved in virulence